MAKDDLCLNQESLLYVWIDTVPFKINTVVLYENHPGRAQVTLSHVASGAYVLSIFTG